jgi:hypothetical protein
MRSNSIHVTRIAASLLFFGYACCVKADLIIENEPNDSPQTANLTVGNGNLAIDAMYDGTPDNFSFLVANLAPNVNPYDGWVRITLTLPGPATVFCFNVFESHGIPAIGGCAPSPVVLDLYPAVQGGTGVYDLAITSVDIRGPYHVSIVATANPGHQPPTLLGTMPPVVQGVPTLTNVSLVILTTLILLLAARVYERNAGPPNPAFNRTSVGSASRRPTAAG